MIYILDRNEKIKGVLKNNIDISNENIYFDDLYTEDLETGADTFKFSTIANKHISSFLVVGNYIAFNKNNYLRLLQITETEEEKTESLIKNVYCETVALELSNSIYDGGSMNDVNVERFLNNILQNTSWKVGYIDSSLTTSLSLNIESKKEIYSLIQEHIKTFGGEIQFRVDIKNNSISGRYIDVYSKRGNIKPKRLEINRNINSISRKINIANYATKLIGIGRDGISFKDIVIDGIDKALGQDFIINKSAFETINNKGNHITKIFEYDTNDPYELLRQTKKALDELSKLQVDYELDINMLDFENTEIGDTLLISDMSFNPPLMLEARISYLETSKSDENNNKAKLTNYKELKSNISKFKLSGKQIIDAINNNTSDDIIDSKNVGIDGTNVSNKINQIETKQYEDSKKIDSKVSQKDINESIENIKIGTVNYALKTDEEKTFILNNTNNQNIACYQVLDDTSNKDVIISFDYEFKDLIINENGDIYFQAMSFKEDETTKWYVPKVECFKNILKEGNSSGSISFKTTFPSFKKGTTLTFRFRADYLEGTFAVKKVQVVTGNKKTDWSQSPFDFDEDIKNLTQKTSKIELTANKISWLIKDGTDEANMELTKAGLKVIADSINLNGLVKFTDLSKENSNTIINGSNIKTGIIGAEFIDVDKLKVNGELITGQINGVDGVKFADGAYVTNYDFGIANGLSFSAPDFQFISGEVHFEYGINSKNNSWSIDREGNCKFNGAISGQNNIQLTNGSIYLPQGGGNQVADYLKLGDVIMAGLNSFHFITKSGQKATIFANNLNTMYSLAENNVSTVSENNVFDIINSVNVIETKTGFRIVDKKAKELIKNNCVNISINEKTNEKDISISVIDTLTIFWKAIQDLKYENNYIKNQIKKGACDGDTI